MAGRNVQDFSERVRIGAIYSYVAYFAEMCRMNGLSDAFFRNRPASFGLLSTSTGTADHDEKWESRQHHPHTEWISWFACVMPSLDRAFAQFLKTQRGQRSYATFAKELGIAESTLYRLSSGEQSVTLRSLEAILRRLELAPADVFGSELNRKRTRR